MELKKATEKIIRFFRSYGLLFIFFAVGLGVLGVSVYAQIIFKKATGYNEKSYKDRMRYTCAYLSDMVTAGELGMYRNARDMERPEYKALRARLVDFAQMAGVRYAFFLRVKGDNFQYIVDNAEGEKKDGLDTPWMQVKMHLPGLQPDSREMHVTKLADYAPGWEGLRSAYAPIFDGDGRIVAHCGADIEDTEMLEVHSNLGWLFRLELVAVLCVLASGIYGFVKYRWEAIEANNANAAKSRFLSRMSHEIRTPMTAVLGMSDLAAIHYGKKQGLEYISYIKQAGNNLLSIINGILDISALESGKLQLVRSPYSIGTVLYDVMAITRIKLRDKTGAKLVFDVAPDIPSTIVGDEMRVREILLNLLTNAVKYTPKGFIRLKVRGRREGAGKVLLTFEVSDSGIGIKPENLKRLFLDFSRVEDRYTSNIEGTGLGLSITLLLSRAMGGDVKVKSLYGVGSTFTATIRQEAEADCPPMGAFNDKEVARPKSADINFIAPDFSVLVVDDVETNLSVTKGLLGPYRMKVDTCTSGADALSLVQGRDYDLVLMDHMMPGMDGIETVAAIRAMGERFDKLPIAALTANVVVGMKEVFLQNGFDDFMAKPIEMAKLHEFIERWVPIEKRVYTDRHAVSLRRLDTESRSLAEKRQLAERRLMTDRRGLSAAMTPSGKWRPVRGAAKQDAPANAPGALGSAGEGAKAAAGLEGLAGIEGLDTGIGLVSAGGSPSAYMELLNIFCRDVYSRIDFMNTPSAERDIYTFATHAHALKSACASIGATALSQEAKLLEDAGKRDDIASIRQGVSGFRDRMTRLTERIATALSAEAKGRPGGRGADGKNTTEAIAPALLGLKKMLGAGDAGDAAAAAAILSELLEMPLDGDVKEALSRASGMVAASDLPGAAKMIEGISG